jgi:MerR family transcriptional regulator, copper efflux regulator
MNIGDAAAASGLPAKTIRFYEEIGLVAPERGPNGYRQFSTADTRRLAFVGRARSLGFSVEDCRALLSLYADRNRASADVKQLTGKHLADIGRKIAELQGMQRTLAHLLAACAGDQRPDCPILDELAG